MFTIVFTALLVGLANAQEWNYDDASGFGPSYWPQSYPACGGSGQSPINIRTNKIKGNLGPLSFYNYDSVASYLFNLTNIGHGVQIKVPNTSFRFTGGGLRGEYTLEQLHFHWGQFNSDGSEHYVNGKDYAAEIHLVHFDSSRYTSVSNALQDPDGVAVLGILVSDDDEDPHLNQAIEGLSGSLTTITAPGQVAKINPFAIQDLLPGTKEYFRYHGSLTTPPCTESVIWTVLKNPVYISKATMDSFRTIYGNDGELLENFRPPQGLYTRTVYQGA